MQTSSNFVVPVAIALIMFGVGLNVSASSFKRVFTHPKAIITGLSAQLIILPMVAFVITSFWQNRSGL